ncbi:hypothetical protein HLRTI_002920 [Halorhabdus tiamatea SARL4B]|uniref:Uncharacterized protein n=1 Tax=Halorhabdus tiamatea SARL4B TaxID=1033806 RepID=U2DZA6_9EURY|nr:hypothetical protein [Halorhabdus tiamatea]ERJ05121.1 hypothetical protein HLRTI_002920 [Halorhabdus tiamatea SARL4B]
MATTTTQEANQATTSKESGCQEIEIADGDYGYIGVDEEGNHHHYHEGENTIYVTSKAAEEFVPEGTVLYYYRIQGEIEEEVDLDKDVFEDKKVVDWIAFIDENRGWQDQPKSIADRLRELLDL